MDNFKKERGVLSDEVQDNDTIDVELSDALLWSDCPEELYLQRILMEHEHGKMCHKGSNESLMGDSTIENLLVPRNNPGIIRKSVDWAPIARSTTTAENSQNSSDHATPVSAIAPRKLNFSDATGTMQTSGGFVGGNKSKKSALRGEPRRRQPSEMVVEIDATPDGMEKTKMSSLSGDTVIQKMLRNGAMYTHAWIPADNFTLSRYGGAIPGTPPPLTDKAIKVAGTPKTQQSSIVVGEECLADDEDQQETEVTSVPFYGFLTRAREEDLMFRRIVSIAMCLLVAFLALSAAAVIKTTVFDNSTDQGVMSYNKEEGGGTSSFPAFRSPTVSPSTSKAPSPSDNANIQQPIEGAVNSTKSALTLTPSSSPGTRQPTLRPIIRMSIAPSTTSSQDPTFNSPSDGPSLLRFPPQPSQLPSFSISELADDINFVAEYNRIIAILEQVAPEVLEAIEDNSSPQFQAIVWLVGDLQQQQQTLSDRKILQRFVLSVFYFSMEGSEWIRSDGWMTSIDECQWFTTSSDSICDDDGALTLFELTANNLAGQIPEEISLLSDSLVQLFLNSNARITGTLPRNFGRLTNLVRLRLTENNIHGNLGELGSMTSLALLAVGRNQLSGEIPSSLSSLRKLRLLDFALNSIGGTVPSELGLLTRLTKMSFTSNELTGTIPSELSRLSQLSELKLRRNSFSGSIPSEVCSIGNLRNLEVSCRKVRCSCCDECS